MSSSALWPYMVKGLGRGTYGLGLEGPGLGLGLGLEILALTTSLKKRCILGTKLLKNTNRKPYTIYRMIILSMTLSDL